MPNGDDVSPSLTWAGVFHCLSMVWLYLCQGLISGVMGVLPSQMNDVLLAQRGGEAQRRGLSSTQMGILGVPLYVFAMKFLWAPVVDRCYNRWLAGEDGNSEGTSAVSQSKTKRTRSAFPWSRFHRRVQYVFPLQWLMAMCFCVLWWLSSNTLRNEEEPNRRSGENEFLLWCASDYGLAVVTSVFLSMSFVSATQDVAVDAWAVEGLPDSRAPLAGSLQMLGLICGATLCNVFIVLKSSYESEWLQLGTLFALCACMCSAGALLSMVLAVVSPLSAHSSSEDTGVASVHWIRYFWQIIRSPRAGAFISILLSRGWPYSAMAILTLHLQSRGVVDSALLSQVRIASTIVSVCAAMFFATRLLRRMQPATALKWNSGFEFGVAVFSLVWFLFSTREATVTEKLSTASSAMQFPVVAQELYIGVIITLSLLSSAVGALSFVAVVSQSSCEAKHFPSDRGTVITVFNAMANMGYTLPSTLVMFMNDPLTRWCRLLIGEEEALPKQGEMVGGLTHTKVLWWSSERISLILLCAIVFMIAWILRRYFLIPSVAVLTAEDTDVSDSDEGKKVQ